MLVEVRDARGETFLARPRLFKNEKSNQMVANPDVKVFLTHDVYVSPIEFDPGASADEADTIELMKGGTTTVGPYAVTFRGFDMAGAHGEGGQITIGATLSVDYEGKSHTVTPTVNSAAEGFSAQPAPLPGARGAAVTLAGVNASDGRVRLAFQGIASGVAAHANLHRGEVLAYGDTRITFRDFDLSQFDPEAGKIHIGAVFDVFGGDGSQHEVTSFLRIDSGGERRENAPLPGHPSATLRVDRTDADAGTVQIEVVDGAGAAPRGEPMRFSVDFSIKPLINLLWLGLAVLLAGGCLALVRRGEDFASTGPGGGSD
jgi:cytochrome c-type biogenesis protein CcmF